MAITFDYCDEKEYAFAVLEKAKNCEWNIDHSCSTTTMGHFICLLFDECQDIVDGKMCQHIVDKVL